MRRVSVENVSGRRGVSERRVSVWEEGEWKVGECEERRV